MRRLIPVAMFLCVVSHGCGPSAGVGARGAGGVSLDESATGAERPQELDPTAAAAGVGVVVEKVATLPGLEAVSDAAWLPPDGSGKSRILFLGLHGAVTTDPDGQNASEVIRPQLGGDGRALGFGTTNRVVRRPDGSVLAISEPGLGGSAAMLWDPLTGRVLWTHVVQSQLAMAAPLRSAQRNEIVTGIAEYYGRQIHWLDESGTQVAVTTDKSVYMGNSFGTYVVTDFDRDGNDELLFGTFYPSGSSQSLGLTQPDGTILWCERVVKDATYLQDIRLGDHSASTDEPSYAIGVSTVIHNIFSGMEDVYFRGTCQNRDGRWTGTWTSFSKAAKWRESERARSIRLPVHESPDHAYVSGNSPEMSSCFYIRLSDHAGNVDRTLLLRRNNKTKRALFSRGAILPGSPPGIDPLHAVIGFGEDMYKVRLVRNGADSLP